MADDENFDKEDSDDFEKEIIDFIEDCWVSIFKNDKLDSNQKGKILNFIDTIDDDSVAHGYVNEIFRVYSDVLRYLYEGYFVNKEEKREQWVNFKQTGSY
jgi:hypothetical protein